MDNDEKIWLNFLNSCAKQAMHYAADIPVDVAHQLEEKGLVEWKGVYLGSNMWRITEAGKVMVVMMKIEKINGGEK